jgi:hypothetical protein
MLTIENSKISFGEHFGLLKFNGSSNFSYFFDASKLDNHYFQIDDIHEIELLPQYKFRPDKYHIVLDINNTSYYLTLELLKPVLQLSNTVVHLNGSKHVGFITNSDFTSKYEYIIDSPNFQIIKNDLFIIDNSFVSKHNIDIVACGNNGTVSYNFQICVYPTVTLSNKVVYLNNDDFYIANIENTDNDTDYIYTLDQNVGDNKYFNIIDTDKLIINNYNDLNNKDDIYSVVIKTSIAGDSDTGICFSTSIYVNINKVKNVYTDLKIELSDNQKYRYHFNKQLSDMVEFSINSLDHERKIKLVFLSGGTLYLSGSNKIEDNTLIYLQPNVEYFFQYQNKEYDTNKIMFHVMDEKNNFSVLEIMITLNNQIFNKVHINNMENISKANYRTSVKALNTNVPDTLNVQVFKLDDSLNKKCVSKLVNGLQIFYTHNCTELSTRSLSSASLVIEPIKLDGPMSNLPAFYIKYIDNDTLDSLVTMTNPINLVLYLPNYKGATNLSAYRLHDTMSGYDGTQFPLTPYYNTTNNTHYSLTLTTNSIYTINNTNYGAQCFLRGSSILTPDGYEKVENLKVGDILLTHQLQKITIRDIVKLEVPSNKNNDPYIIPKNSFGAICDLYLSPLHQVLIGDTFVPVKYIPGLRQQFMGFNLEYYHFKTDDYFRDTVIADGVITETWSGFDPMETEFNETFLTTYNDVKMEHSYRKLLVV